MNMSGRLLKVELRGRRIDRKVLNHLYHFPQSLNGDFHASFTSLKCTFRWINEILNSYVDVGICYELIEDHLDFYLMLSD